MTAQSPFFQMRVKPEERERLRALAAEEGKSQSDVIRELIREASARNARQVARLFNTNDESSDAVA